MRTRDEQITQLSRWLTQVFPEGSDEAEKQILEAEQRAEQRVRAENVRLRLELARICDSGTPRTTVSMRKIAHAALKGPEA